MSLKTFHVIFISFSVTTAVIFGLWALDNYRQNLNIVYIITAVSSFVTAIGLALYEYQFIQKIPC